MRTLYFLVPGTTGKFACGGLFAELNALALAQQVCAAEVVTYRQREPDTLFLADVLQQPRLDVIFVLSWGFDVPKLAKQLRSHHTIYHAHSSGYGFRVPAGTPIITVSRNTMGYWGQLAPHSLIYYLPNQISDQFQNRGQPRDIDVLVQARKSSHYLLEQLVPALKEQCNVFVLDAFVDDLSELFNRAKVYLYDSAEYWAREGVSEGFGLQPMEAAACGCQVFSSVNGGLSDYLDPGFNSHKIAGYSCEFDVQRVLAALSASLPLSIAEPVFTEYRSDNIVQRLQVILTEVNQFFDHKEMHLSNIQPLTSRRIAQLRVQKLWQKLRTKFKR
ncbi:MAG: glycosyltransferase [Thermosynechococcaceae cyanobacterium]